MYVYWGALKRRSVGRSMHRSVERDYFVISLLLLLLLPELLEIDRIGSDARDRRCIDYYLYI